MSTLFTNIQCDNCYGLMYKKVKMNVCEQCGHYLKMSSSERIELSIDPGPNKKSYSDLTI
jgi:acetyl-CoA carboxylase beta subunit